MPELIAKDPHEGRVAITRAGATLAPLPAGPIWSVALFAGRPALPGPAFPGQGEVLDTGAARLVWTGRDQAFVFGDLPEAWAGAAAVSDQSGGWAGVSLSGPGAVAALSRLVAVDLRPAAFAPGQVVRTGLNHLSAVILRTGDQAFEIWVFRSMARTAWHELAEVLNHLEARAALGV